MRRTAITTLIIFISFLSFPQNISRINIEKHISILSSDLMEGRKPGSNGDVLSANYIAEQFKSVGLRLNENTGLQEFEIVANVELGTNNLFLINDSTSKILSDYVPLSFSGRERLEAEVVFVGYGFDFKTEKIEWNDYQNVDVRGKWVIVLLGHPEIDSSFSVFSEYADERSKVILAKDKGAGGVIFVSGKKLNEKDELMELFYDKSSSGVDVPVINITRKLANKILSPAKTIEELESNLNLNRKPESFAINKTVKGITDIIQTKIKTNNIIGILEGTEPILKNEYIVIGAHYDHLGMGGKGSGSRMPDTSAVHNGADDNASGVALMIELAREFSKLKNQKRSIIFIAFGAEEMGLLGSKYFIEKPIVERNKIKAMFNFDMVGRLRNKSLSLGGVGTAKEIENILFKYSDTTKLVLSTSPEGFGPSDHANFYSNNIPVFFDSTGAHADYHMPFDDKEYLNMEGIKIVGEYFYPIISEILDLDTNLTFQESGQKAASKHGGKLKVTLGIVPNFSNQDGNGLGVDGVTKGGSAEHGGIKKGDIITALNGNTVKNIYDYMFRLKKLELGQTITVDINRSGEKIILLIQL
ncbi:MAG: hypothetical protein A2265_09180 [Bacteroidetes bacterium RIFOXYA12_FULL_33_9]|nr:MAG: hypothetical protein A2265_09180 [Bacteroidetes bacterium RIFOXYA12_FULL_33_9]